MLSYMKPPFGGWGGNPRGSARLPPSFPVSSSLRSDAHASLGRLAAPFGKTRFGLKASRLLSPAPLARYARPCGLSILRSARSSGAHPAPPLFAGLTSPSECPKPSATCCTQESMHLGPQIYIYTRMPKTRLFMPKFENRMYTHSRHCDDSQCTFRE